MRTADQSIKELKQEARKMSTLMTDVVLGVISPKVCNATCRASAKRVKEIAKARQRGSRYLVSIPKPGAVPPGMVVVHNHIKPARLLGWNGFRAWLQSPDDPPTLEVCPCRWAPELGRHYRVKAMWVRAKKKAEK